METYPMKLVTIIAEAVIEHRLTADLRDLGAAGFTVVDGRGEGTRRRRASELPGANVRVEAVVSSDAGDRILAHLARHYFADYSLVAYVADVAVVRSEKYVATEREQLCCGQPRADQ